MMIFFTRPLSSSGPGIEVVLGNKAAHRVPDQDNVFFACKPLYLFHFLRNYSGVIFNGFPRIPQIDREDILIPGFLRRYLW